MYSVFGWMDPKKIPKTPKTPPSPQAWEFDRYVAFTQPYYYPWYYTNRSNYVPVHVSVWCSFGGPPEPAPLLSPLPVELFAGIGWPNCPGCYTDLATRETIMLENEVCWI